jgi:hypothetical protein
MKIQDVQYDPEMFEKMLRWLEQDNMTECDRQTRALFGAMIRLLLEKNKQQDLTTALMVSEVLKQRNKAYDELAKTKENTAELGSEPSENWHPGTRCCQTVDPLSYKGYWYVYEYGNMAPTIRHDTEESAKKEAERLALANPGHKYEVLKLAWEFSSAQLQVKGFA